MSKYSLEPRPPPASAVIAEARASLRNPSRPFTPAALRETDRRRGNLSSLESLTSIESIAIGRLPRRLMPISAAAALVAERKNKLIAVSNFPSPPQPPTSSSFNNNHSSIRRRQNLIVKSDSNYNNESVGIRPTPPRSESTSSAATISRSSPIMPISSSVSSSSCSLLTTLDSILEAINETMSLRNNSSSLSSNNSHLFLSLSSFVNERSFNSEDRSLIIQTCSRLVDDMVRLMQQDDDDKCEKLGLDEDQELHVPRKDYSGMIIASEIVLSRIRGTLVICRENVVAARSCIRALFKLSTRPEYDEELKRGKVVVSAILPLLEELLLVLRQDGGVVAAVDGEVWMFALAILGNLSMNTTSRSSSTFEESSKDVDEDTRKLILKHVHVLMQAANVQLEQQKKPSDNSSLWSLEQEAWISAFMVQTSGIIRNLTSLAPTKRFKAAFFTQDFVTSMMMWLEGCQNVEAIVLNVARIFTRLSQSSEFVDLLREGGGDGRHTEVLLHLLFHYQQETPILVRICYILGNLTMVLTREQAAHFEKNVPDLIALLESVASFGQHQNVEEEEKEEQKEKTGNNVSDHHHQSQQALIKIIRLVANLAVDPVIGKQMVGMIELECLVALLGNIGDIVGSADNDNGEELQLNILAALANFSFYGEEHCNYIYGRRLEIGKILLPILMHHDNEEAVAESARIMANYSRYEDVQQLLVKEHGLALFTILLDHVHREVVYQAVGVLVNLSTRGGALIIMENDGFEKLYDVLEKTIVDQDWCLGATTCKALHNIIASVRVLLEDAKVKDQLEVCVSKLKHTLFVLLEKKEEGEGIGGGQDDNEEIVDEKQEFFIIIKRLLNLI